MRWTATVAVALVISSVSTAAGFSFTANGQDGLPGRTAFLAQPRASIPSESLMLTQGDVDNAFHALDLDEDGVISDEEIGKFAGKQGHDPSIVAGEFAALDKNGDHGLSLAEFSSALDDAEPIQRAKVHPVIQSFDQRIALDEPLIAGSRPPQPAFPSPTVTADAASAKSAASLVTTAAASTEASTAAAQSAAKMVVDQLAVEEKEDKAAQDLENQAAELRANASAMLRWMSQRALSAGQEAAKKKANEVLASLVELENSARENEVQAASLRANSNAELKQAKELSTFVDSALRLVGAP